MSRRRASVRGTPMFCISQRRVASSRFASTTRTVEEPSGAPSIAHPGPREPACGPSVAHRPDHTASPQVSALSGGPETLPLQRDAGEPDVAVRDLAGCDRAFGVAS